MTSNIQIAHLIDLLRWGGAQKLLVTFVETAARRGIRPLVISLQPNKDNSPLPDQLKILGADVVMLSISSLAHTSALPTLVRVLHQKRVDILHTHLTHANILGPVAGWVAGVPVVSTLHNTKLRERGYHRLRMVLENFALRRLTRRIIAVGQTVAEVNQSRLGKSRMDVIPNAVAPGVILSLSDRIALRNQIMGDSDRLLLISIGRLTPQKAYADLLEAFAKTREQFLQTHLAIVGDGHLRADLETKIQVLRLQDHVSLLGLREDVPQLLAASDIYVSSSHWEGLSVAMLEAMAAGLPIVATSVGDALHLLANDRGLLVPPKNISSLTEALTRAIAQPELRHQLGGSARFETETHYSPDAWLNSLLQVYSETLGRSI